MPVRPPASVQSKTPTESPGLPCTCAEVSIQSITRMMAQQCAPAEILEALCRYVGEAAEETQVGFYRIDGEGYKLAATGDVTPAARALFMVVSPEAFDRNAFVPGSVPYRPEPPFRGGWLRHVCSGAGELMGTFVGLSDSPAPPAGLCAVRIETACQLAAVALDRHNMTEELTFRGESDSPAPVPEAACNSEISVQQVAQMIARQCSPAEILQVLCREAGRTEAERQVAFFLIQNDEWTLAASGDLTPETKTKLTRIDPGALSNRVFELTEAVGDPLCPCDSGWVRQIFSGAGELLGIFVVLSDDPVLPGGAWATRIKSVCGLASLALEQSNLIRELTFKADHDALTGLLNRAHYERALGSALEECGRMRQSVALLYINLDRFRLVNEVMGAAIGNLLLRQVGCALKLCVRERDVVARAGGDEFVVLLMGVAARKNAEVAAARLLQSLSRPFFVEGHELFAGASVGIACSTPESTPETLERQARLALHEAKRTGKGRWMHFDAAMAATPPERLEMEKKLRSALGRNEMMLYYQPQVDLSSGLIRGAEALLRWRPEGLGNVSPATFIPILEETGMIAEFGLWILTEACRQGTDWSVQHGLRVRIGVNVSPLQFIQPNFVSELERVLNETGFPREMLELELTESLFVGDFAHAQRVCRSLQEAGVTLALDDFGTGQSSLSYLHKLPFQRLKIDQSFIRGIRDGEQHPPLVQDIIRMAQALRMKTIAEGVETPYQAELLSSLGCEEAQGFGLARPLPPGDFLEFCRNHRDGVLIGNGVSAAVRPARSD